VIGIGIYSSSRDDLYYWLSGAGYGNSSHFVRAITFLGKKKAKSLKIRL
jgi:hypothetical protein